MRATRTPIQLYKNNVLWNDFSIKELLKYIHCIYLSDIITAIIHAKPGPVASIIINGNGNAIVFSTLMICEVETRPLFGNGYLHV